MTVMHAAAGVAVVPQQLLQLAAADQCRCCGCGHIA